MNSRKITGFSTIFIDADDTLWANEGYFRDAESQFAQLLMPDDDISEVQKYLWEKQEENIALFGYGSKTYLISMVDAAMEICGGNLSAEVYKAIKQIITNLALHDPVVYDGVEDTLKALSAKYRLVLATKGDAVEQMLKVQKSGLQKYFSAIEVMKNKEKSDYQLLCDKFSLKGEEMLMVGNSVRSDVIPPVELGGTSIYIPSDIVWTHELADMPESDKIFEISEFFQLKYLLL